MTAPLPADERQQFEAAMRKAFGCSENSFVRAQPWGYINTVMSQTFGGRVQPNYADVQMLWKTWQAARTAVPVEISDEQALKRLGEEMYAMTTTVHSPNIPFEEACAMIPGLWLQCMKESAALRARLGGQTGSDGVNPSGKEQR